MPAPWPESEEESEAKRPRVAEESLRSRECRRSIQSAGGFCWSSSDLVLAAKLLETPNARFPSITFSNAEEERRVFTLVYDVLRYKTVLNQALNDVYFFMRYPYLKERCHLVWLLFLDLYKRDFTLRDVLEAEVEQAFQSQGLFEIDEVLWQLRVKLAATVSRLRIKSGAHSLSNLLPHHLQLTRSATEENIITGWVNIFKTNLNATCGYLESCGFVPLARDRELLEPFTYKTDHLLPRFLHILPNLREELIESPLLQEYNIVMQERTFCLGPAVMAEMLKHYSLSGKVAQTHVNSPITTAYFANLLINNEKIESLLVFGAGYRKEACEQYLRELGVKNTLVFSENFAGLSPESRVLDNVIAVLATPPNTNSSVVDPVDLAVARGGDLQILQQLTDDDFASTPRGDNIDKFLRDQRDTLRRAMSKPQIQFIVYETHSRFHCENEEMAVNLVNELNNYAREVHLEELRRAQGETQEKERSQAEANSEGGDIPNIRVEEELSLPLPSPTQTVQIPPSDLFEIADLPDLCPNMDNCLDLVREGTYIAVIKRKEITRLDPKYMIQMAEARGLFGRPDVTPKAKTPGQTARAKAALAALQARSDSFEKSKTKVKVEMDRIAAPTRASMLRDVRPPSNKDCPRYTHHLAHDGTPSYMYPEEENQRKTFLTAEEEEELIRRLYTCSHLNVFPPKLYEDLPPLKFWDSPASIIECYLQRKVFQKRLQLAYEFNQSKDTNEHSLQNTLNGTPDPLTKAVNQLTEDIQYFTHLRHQPDSGESKKAKGDGNKEYWDEIHPEVITTPQEENFRPDEDEAITIVKSYSKLQDDIKRRFSDYKNFYRLQNVKREKNPPLSLTIDKLPQERDIQKEGSVSISLSQEQSLISSEEMLGKLSLEEHEMSHSFSRLPYLISDSETEIKKSVKFKKKLINVPNVSHNKDSLLPLLAFDNFDDNFNDRGTLLSLRDSIEIARKRMSSRVSRISLKKDNTDLLPQATLVTHKDSYVMLTDKLHKVHRESLSDSIHTHVSSLNLSSNNRTSVFSFEKTNQRSTLIGHQDSVLLTQRRLTPKEKEVYDLSCSICNNGESKSIQFLCSFHANYLSSNQQIYQSIIAKGKSRLSHRDSVLIARKKVSLTDNKKSKSCQVNEMNFQEGRPSVKDIGIRGTRKSKKNEDSIKQERLDESPSNLKSYLLNAVKINQIITDNDSSTRK